ncbi:MAG: hypothetical protein HC892_01560 [Saprospiraceae bacterium]|nr:hypothetical protein [Saprospiraceae bacterium]
MASYTPQISKTFEFEDDLLIDSGSLDFNEFNQGVISEQYECVGYSVFSHNKQQLEQPLVIDFRDTKGNRKIFNKTPRIDSYQSANILNCLEVKPPIKCDSMNRFSYDVEPTTDLILVIRLDKRRTKSQKFKLDANFKDQNTKVIADMYSGYNIYEVEQVILPNIKKKELQIKFDKNGKQIPKPFLNSNNVPYNVFHSAEGNKNNSKFLKYTLIGLSCSLLLYGLYKAIKD